MITTAVFHYNDNKVILGYMFVHIHNGHLMKAVISSEQSQVVVFIRFYNGEIPNVKC